MDLVLYLWIALSGTLPPAILGYVMYRIGLQRGRAERDEAKKEIKEEISRYVKEDLAVDLIASVDKAIMDGIRGALGPIGKGGSIEGRAAAAEYAQQNPGIASLLTSVAAKGASRWLGKKLGVPRDVVDTLGGSAPFLPMGIGQRKKPDIEPIQFPQV